MSLIRAPTGESGKKIREQMKRAAPLFTIPMVCYATEGTANSATKITRRDDQGSLEISQDTITFKGAKFIVPIDRESIGGLDLTTPKPAWLALLAANAILLLDPLRPHSAVLVIGGMALMNGFILLIMRLAKWICIRYEDKADGPTKTYFAAASDIPWPGIFGGTQRIHDKLSGWLGACHLHGTKP
jgi:hypothetical protein